MTRLLPTSKQQASFLSAMTLLLTSLSCLGASTQIEVRVKFVESGASLKQSDLAKTIDFNSHTPASAQLTIENSDSEIVLHYPVIQNHQIKDLGENAESITLTYY